MNSAPLFLASVGSTLSVCGCAALGVSDLTLGVVACVAATALVRWLHAQAHRDIPESVLLARKLGRQSPEYVSPTAPTPRCGPAWAGSDDSQLTKGRRRG